MSGSKSGRTAALLKKVRSNRRLLLEGLERRELMAADVGAYYNPIIPADVSGDFKVTPLDALQVINALSDQTRTGSRLGSARPTAATAMNQGPMIDVSKDGLLTPLDALLVINSLNTAEGVNNPIVSITTQILDSNGTVVNPVGNTYTLGVDQAYSLRLVAQDRRADSGGTAEGVFAVYADLNYQTVGAPTQEVLQPLWGEYQELGFSNNLRSGSFVLDFNGTQTGTIQVATNSDGSRNAFQTANNIRNAIGALSFIGGVANVRVSTFNTTGRVNFGISYLNAEARVDQPNPTFVTASTNLVSSNANPVTTFVNASADPSLTDVIAAAFAFPVNAATDPSTGNSISVSYLQGVLASLTPRTGNDGFVINDLGGFSPFAGTPSFDDGAGSPVEVVDTKFRGSRAGQVNVDFTPANGVGSDILLYGSQTPIPSDQVTYPSPFQIIFVENITASSFTVPAVNEDSGSGPQILIDSSRVSTVGGVTFTVETFTQGSNGTVVRGSNATNGLVYRPNDNFFGQDTFTYTVLSSAGDRSTGTITINVNPVNDAPIALDVTPAPSIAEGSTTPLTFTSTQLFSAGPGESTGPSAQTVALSNPTIITPNTGAQVTINSSGALVFTPGPDYFGNVVVSVTGTDNGTPALSTPTTLTIGVTAVNDPPQVNQASGYPVAEGSTITIAASSLFRPGPFPVGEEVGQTVIITQVNNVTGSSAGNIEIINSGANVRFQGTPDFNGNFIFTAIARDVVNGTPDLSSSAEQFTITVTPVNDGPVAVPDTGSSNALNAPPAELNVLANDTDVEGDELFIVAITPLTGPSASLSSISIRPDGKRILFTPGVGLFNITQSFTYTISDRPANDPTGLRSTTNADVFIAPLTLPLALGDLINVDEGGSVEFNVLSNDLVNDGQTAQLVDFTPPPLSQGRLTRLDNGTPNNPSDDRFRFEPADDFFTTPNNPVTFTYTMRDTSANSTTSTGTVTINVRPVNDAPTAVNQTFANTVLEDQPFVTIPLSLLLTGSSPGHFQWLALRLTRRLLLAKSQWILQEISVLFQPPTSMDKLQFVTGCKITEYLQLNQISLLLL
jgi:hypothetical protein